jgi:DNA-binding XRE family transcriptional regulator
MTKPTPDDLAVRALEAGAPYLPAEVQFAAVRAWLDSWSSATDKADLVKAVGIARQSWWEIATARAMPRLPTAARIADLATARGVPATAAQVMGAQAARIADRVGYVGREVWPDAPWAKALDAKTQEEG